MVAAAIIQGFPSVAVPFVAGDTFQLTIPWYQFLRALWERTGGGTGAGFISEINTTDGLKGGPANAAHPIVTFTLDLIGDNTILSNITGISAIPVGNSLTALIDSALGSTHGDILYRNGTTWTVLGPGTSGNFLKTQGAAANPVWASASFGSSIANNDILSNISGGSASPIGNTLTDTIDSAIASTQGDILYRNSTAWVALGPGTAGQILQTGGAAANPQWVNTASLGALVGLANSTQALNNGSETLIAWDSATWDTGSFWSAGSPTVLTIPTGVTKVAIRAGLEAIGTSTGSFSLYVKKNASQAATGLPMTTITGLVNASLSISGACVVAATDTLTLGVVVNGVGLTAGQYQTFLEVEVLV